MDKIGVLAMGDSYMSVKTMNDIAGQLDGSPENVDLAISLVFEELCEVIDAFEQKNPAELVKEVADLWVVTAGLIQKLEAAGFDMRSTLEVVDENNLSKFPTERPKSYPKEVDRVEFNERYGRYVLKRADGKFLKPAGYQKADVSGFANQKFFV